MPRSCIKKLAVISNTSILIIDSKKDPKKTSIIGDLKTVESFT